MKERNPHELNEDYIVDKIREFARIGVIDHRREIAELQKYGVPLESAISMADLDSIASGNKISGGRHNDHRRSYHPNNLYP